LVYCKKVFSNGIHVTVSAVRVVGTDALLICDKFIVTAGSWLMINAYYMIGVLLAVTLIAADSLVISGKRQAKYILMCVGVFFVLNICM
jgi:hypothetical protein